MSFAKEHKVCIAPMMQYTDMHDRYLLRLISKKVYLYTEMVTTGAILFGKCFHQLEYNPQEHPVAVQLGGSDIKDLVECAKISEDYGYDEINLNVGCPSDRVQKGRFGACLMLEPNHVADCLSSMQDNVSIPVSIKCRLGVDDHVDYEFLYNFVNIIRESGINNFVIHARNGILKGLSPRQNRHIPPLKYDYVYNLKKDFPNLNIIINGGIKSIDETKQHLEHVDGVMIGRAAYENPFLIKDIDSEIYGLEYIKKSKKIILNQYLDYVEEKITEGHEISRMMKHLFGLSRGDKFAKIFRLKILEIIRLGEIKSQRKDLEDLLFY
ncbi:tRNA dihydrouridine(20/20a) synthase DusA [Gammaproteobacteria bacterium]|nr:tRNA dihydrouridine(20/20a) synthase DusA [Gammaproteobacteria bacterium]